MARTRSARLMMSELRSILLVDDDPILVESLEAILEREYEVRSAADGEQAIASILENPPHLIVLDIMMTYPSEGYDLASKLKSDPQTAHIPIIMLTGVDQMFDLRFRAEQSWAQCDAFFTKPPDIERLLDSVRELIL